jgi:PAS domain S-box-containing protein
MNSSILVENTEELKSFKDAVLRIRNCIVISTDSKGIVNGFNVCAEKIFNLEKCKALEKKLTDLLFPLEHLKNSGLQQPSFIKFLKEIRDAGESEQSVYSKTGQEIQIVFSAEKIVPLDENSGYIFSGFDITEQRRIESAFEGIQLFNEKLLSTTPTVLYLYDFPTQQIVFSNRDFYSSFGYTEEEFAVLKSSSLENLVHPDDHERRRIHLTVLKNSADGEITEGEFRLRHSDGSWLWMQNRDTVFTRNEDGMPTLILGAALDISERKKYESKLNEANAKLNETNQLLTSANNLKTELLGIAAHDLKNPLSVIKNLASILETNQQQEVGELSTIIKQSAQQMLSLINELLESSALESGRYPLFKEKTDLGVLLQHVVEGNLPSAKKKQQELHVNAEPGCIITADASSIRRVFDNLISNAIKYSPLNKNIDVRLFKKKKLVCFEVKDCGPGLSEDDKQKIFGKFQRLHAQPTGGESSSGLGLSIVKQIIDLHNGRVWAESEGKDKGTTFIVELPVKT